MWEERYINTEININKGRLIEYFIISVTESPFHVFSNHKTVNIRELTHI